MTVLLTFKMTVSDNNVNRSKRRALGSCNAVYALQSTFLFIYLFIYKLYTNIVYTVNNNEL